MFMGIDQVTVHDDVLAVNQRATIECELADHMGVTWPDIQGTAVLIETFYSNIWMEELV